MFNAFMERLSWHKFTKVDDDTALNLRTGFAISQTVIVEHHFKTIGTTTTRGAEHNLIPRHFTWCGFQSPATTRGADYTPDPPSLHVMWIKQT